MEMEIFPTIQQLAVGPSRTAYPAIDLFHNYIQLNHTQRLLKSNDLVPTESENAEIIRLMNSTVVDSQRLSEHIQYLPRLDPALKVIRKEYLQDVTSTQSIFSFIRRVHIPVEILGEIFWYAGDMDLVSSPSALEKTRSKDARFHDSAEAFSHGRSNQIHQWPGAWCFSLVCRHWRDAALRSPKLWSFILSTERSRAHPDSLEIMEAWLARSQRVPLTVCLMGHVSTMSPRRSAIDALMETTHRWKTSVSVFYWPAGTITSQSAGHFPLLEHLDLGTHISFYRVGAFKHVPRLKTAIVPRSNFLPYLSLPLAHLVRLEIGTLESGSSSYICMDILARMKHLEVLSIYSCTYLKTDNRFFPLPPGSVPARRILPSLRSLSLPLEFALLFAEHARINSPFLIRLELSISCDHTRAPAGNFVSPEKFFHWLSSQSSLSTLNIRHHTVVTHSNDGLAGLFHALPPSITELQFKTDGTLWAGGGFWIPTSGTLENLQLLSLEFRIDLFDGGPSAECQDIAQMVEQRWKSGNGSLRKLNLKISGYVPIHWPKKRETWFQEKIQGWEMEGLDISFEFMPFNRESRKFRRPNY